MLVNAKCHTTSQIRNKRLFYKCVENKVMIVFINSGPTTHKPRRLVSVWSGHNTEGQGPCVWNGHYTEGPVSLVASRYMKQERDFQSEPICRKKKNNNKTKHATYSVNDVG